MAEPLNLRLGPDQPSPHSAELSQREASLRATVEKYIPDFAVAVQDLRQQQVDTILVHQDAFARNLEVDEFTILGMAIKYAGFYGINVSILGTNRET